MASSTLLLIMIAVFLVLALLGLPIAISIGVASLGALLMQGDIPLTIMAQRMYSSVNSVTLMGIPFFMLVGNIMGRSGITARMIRFCNAIVGWMMGGLCYAATLAGMMLGAVSGSAPASTAVLSSVMVPKMEELGYKREFSSAIMVASGSIGIIIPPSMPMIVLGSLTGISVGKLFMGGVIPGIMIGLSFMIVSFFVCKTKGYGEAARVPFSMKELWESFKQAILPMIAPIIIMGGIMSGVFTATESAVVAVVYTLFLGVFIYRTIALQDLPKLFAEAMLMAANVMLIIAASSVFAWILQSNNFGQIIQSLFSGALHSKILIMVIVNLIFFAGGFFLEGTAMQIMFIPILYPIVTLAGIDPVAFGVTVIVNIALGTITPPVAVCLYVASSSANVAVEKIIKEVIPYVIALAVDIVILILCPQLITFMAQFVS